MAIGVCVPCATLVEGSRECPRCRSMVSRSRAGLVAWEKERARERIAAWAKDGLIEAEVAERLRMQLELEGNANADAHAERHAEAEAEANEKARGDAKAAMSALERRADGVVGGAGELVREIGERWKRLAKSIEVD